MPSLVVPPCFRGKEECFSGYRIVKEKKSDKVNENISVKTMECNSCYYSFQTTCFSPVVTFVITVVIPESGIIKIMFTRTKLISTEEVSWTGLL